MKSVHNISGSVSSIIDSISPDLQKELPLAAIFFNRGGTMNSIIIAPEDPDSETVTLAVDFASYAFSRKDWMAAYVDKVCAEGEAAKKPPRPSLRLIQGGLSANSGSLDLI